MLFSEVLEMWWFGDKINLREISIYKKWDIIRSHIIPYFGNVYINQVDDVMINNFIVSERKGGNHITKKSLCENTIIKELSIINSIMEYALKKGYICDNPMILIKKLKKVPVRQFEIFSHDEVKLVKVARPKWLADMIILAYNTGMRKCECFGLKWSDIDFENKSLTVVRSVTAAKPHDRFVTEPKTKTSKRVILLDNTTFDMLKKRFKNKTSNEWYLLIKLAFYYHRGIVLDILGILVKKLKYRQRDFMI